VKSIISSNPKLEEDLTLHVKGIEIQAKNWMDELMRYLSTIKKMGKIGPIEEAIIKLTLHREGSRKVDNLESLLTNISKTYLEFSERKTAIFERLKQLVPSSQVFTVRQKRILDDFMNLTELADKALNLLRFYDQTRYLTDALIRYYEVLPESETEMKELKDIQAELATLYLVVQLMLRTPMDEARMIDEYLTYVNGVMAKYIDKKGVIDNELLRVQEERKRKDFDRLKLEKELRRILSTKKYAREQLIQIERDMKRTGEEESYVIEKLDKLDGTLKSYNNLADKIKPTSEYRKRLNKIVDLYTEFEEKMAYIRRPKKYFEKSTELTETEQMKIIFKILTEQEETLTRDSIQSEIIDMEHFKDYMKSVIRVFKTPSVLGFKPTYKSDYIWVTVETPPDLWSEDLSQEIYTVLAGYVTSEVSRTITVRVVEARDEWTTRVLVVAGRGKPEHMEAFDEMQLLYNKSNDFERHLSRSYLIEHGVTATQVIRDINNNNSKEKKK